MAWTHIAQPVGEKYYWRIDSQSLLFGIKSDPFVSKDILTDTLMLFQDWLRKLPATKFASYQLLTHQNLLRLVKLDLIGQIIRKNLLHFIVKFVQIKINAILLVNIILQLVKVELYIIKVQNGIGIILLIFGRFSSWGQNLTRLESFWREIELLLLPSPLFI